MLQTQEEERHHAKDIRSSNSAKRTLESASGHNRKSVTATRMSAIGGKAEVDFGRLKVCL